MIDRLISICKLIYVQLSQTLDYNLEKWLYYFENDLASIYTEECSVKEHLKLLDKTIKTYLALIDKFIQKKDDVLESNTQEFLNEVFSGNDIKVVMSKLFVCIFLFSILLLFSSMNSLLFCIIIFINLTIIIIYHFVALIVLLSTEILASILQDLVDIIDLQVFDNFIKNLKRFIWNFWEYKIDHCLLEYKGFMLKLERDLSFLSVNLLIKMRNEGITGLDILVIIMEECNDNDTNYLIIVLLPVIFVYFIYKVFYINELLFFVIKNLCWFVSFNNYPLSISHNYVLLGFLIILLFLTFLCIYLLYKLTISWVIYKLNYRHDISEIISYLTSSLLFMFMLYIQCLFFLLICQEVTCTVFHIIHNEITISSKGEINFKNILISFSLSKSYYFLINSYILIFLFFYINSLKKKWIKFHRT